MQVQIGNNHISKHYDMFNQTRDLAIYIPRTLGRIAAKQNKEACVALAANLFSEIRKPSGLIDISG